jgi:CheY-like chemotaxis protein/signal transduction histidine kinase
LKLKDVKIGTQMRFGLGAILLFVTIVGCLAWMQADTLWQQTKGLYDHPLMVRVAVGELKADILAMQRRIKDLPQAESAQEQQEILQNIDNSEADAKRQFEIIFDRYMGPRSDIDAAFQTFLQWKTIRADTIRLLHEGKVKEVVRRTKDTGICGTLVINLLGEVQKIFDFAKKQGDKFYLNATKQNEFLKKQLIIIVCFIFILSLSLSYILLKGIRNPIQELTEVANHFRMGRLDARTSYVSDNELGTLSAIFNTLGETIESEMTFKERSAQLNDAMLRELKENSFRTWVLEQLMKLTNSQAGAIYLLNEKKSDYEHLESIGLGSSGRMSFSATEREGELGAALITRQIQRITNIQPDTRFAFTAASREFTPREIITIPLISGGEVPAMISLASLHDYEPTAIRLITGIHGALASWMSSMLSNQRIMALTRGLEQQNLRLQLQQEELRVANEELEEQTQQLQRSEEELRTQQEELRVTNEELEEKNNLLERQTKEVERARKDIEEKAESLALASKYKSEFLANMSHELRTPLNSLLLLAQGFTRNREGNLTEEQVESARIIYAGGSDLLTLINEILDLSKIEAGRIELQLGTVLVSDLAEGVRESFQHVASEKGIGLEIVVSDDALVQLSSDRKRIDQVIRNLIANAIKFTETGSVTVTFGRPASETDISTSGIAVDDCLAIAVRDTGIGIDPKLHKVIFEAFQQADGGTSRKYGGTGLGLSISRELATLLGGEICLVSEPGKGSTFTLLLPEKTDKQAETRQATTPPPKQHAAEEKMHPQIPDDRSSIEPSDRVMLIIEDDHNFAKLLQDQCHEKGFKCLAASTGEAGLELAGKYLPRAAILDLQLPGMDGWEVLSALKGNTRTRHIPVHIISAQEASTSSLRKGAVGHVTKPLKLEALEEAFRKLDQVSAGRPKRLLVVDDDAAIRRNTLELISDSDVSVDEAGSAEQAGEALRSGKYDCVVMDLGLPDMDGGELLARLEREGVELPPVVVYTARDLTQDEEKVLRERAESIVIKDVRSQERLLDEVSLFLHRVVSQMPERKRKVIQDLHETDALLKDKKVLVVDDDMRTTFAVSHLLAEYNMKPLKAENGERALRLLDEQPDIDLVLMDIMMPVMDGYETMQRIRDQERFRSLPIIALTAKAMQEDREKCLVAGANDYLPKPLDQERLFSLMRVWLYR